MPSKILERIVDGKLMFLKGDFCQFSNVEKGLRNRSTTTRSITTVRTNFYLYNHTESLRHTINMSFLNDETNAKRAAIIAATVVIGGAVTYFLWDRYSTEDQQEWAAKKKQAASNMKNNVSNKVSDLKDSAVEKAEAVKDKVSLYSLYHIS